MKNLFRATMLMISVILLTATIAPMAKGEVYQNESFSAGQVVHIPCANQGFGENVYVSGQLHILVSQTVNQNNFRYKVHIQPQGWSGIGTVTGDKY